MKKLIVAFGLFLMIGAGAQPTSNDPFPIYTPFTDVEDIELNSRQYYAVDAAYEVSSNTCSYSTPECKKGTYRYNYDQGSAVGDGNSEFDVYYMTEWDSISAPNGKPLVVLLHGIDGNKNNSTGMIRRANEMAKRGYVAVVPNYTTASDDIYGGNPFEECINKPQTLYIFQRSLREIRAVIKRTMYLASTPISDVKIDSSSVFLWGYSYGAVTALHLAYSDISDYPTGEITINGIPQTFSEDLNDINICNTSETGCINSYFNTDYDPSEHLKGTSAMAGFLSSPSMMDPSDTIPLLMFHGTCDGITPFDVPTARQASYRRQIYRNQQVENITQVPCHDEANPNSGYTLFGSEAIWIKIRNLENANPAFDPYKGFLRICGASHELNFYYGIRGNRFINRPGIMEYETFRFFSNIMLGNEKEDFAFNLSQDQRSDRNFTSPLDSSMTLSDVDSAFCSSVPLWGDVMEFDSAASVLSFLKGDPEGTARAYIARSLCPSCDENAPTFIGSIRYPYFVSNNADNNRYQAFDPGDCPPEVSISETAEAQHHSANLMTIQVYDHMGSLVKNTQITQQTQAVNKNLLTELKLESGLYFLHFENGEKKTIMIQ